MQSIGLQSGLSNILFKNILYSHKDGDMALRAEAEELLDVIGAQIALTNDYSFEEGISGIGWMIEYFNQNRLLTINTDDILEQIDDNVYRFALSKLAAKDGQVNELLNLVNYFQLRDQSRNYGRHRYRSFVHKDCIKLISDKLIGYLQDYSSIAILSQVVLKVSFLLKTYPAEKMLEEAFFESIEFLHTYFLRELNGRESGSNLLPENCYLILLAIKQYHNPYWQEEFEGFLSEIEAAQAGREQEYKVEVMKAVYQDTLNEKSIRALIAHKEGINIIIFHLTNYHAFQILDRPSF